MLALVALGGNLGDRGRTLAAAVRRLRAEPGLRVVAVSRFYATAPVGGPPGQPDYLNAAVSLETDLSPLELLRFLLQVEHAFGRERSVPDAPRTLDLDLLLCENVTLNTPELTLPHPRMHLRGFVLAPLADIAPDIVHPTTGKTVRELLAELTAADLAGVRVAELRDDVPQTLAGLKTLVTGSTAGIGRAIAVEFAARGAAVGTHGRRPGPGMHFAADLADSAAVDRLADESWAALGGIDVLICNAGADTLTGPAAKWDFDRKLDALLAVDLKATMRLSRNVGERMKARGRGLILTVGWDQADTGMDGDSGQLFAAVKAAVMAFTRSLAVTLAPQVRVNGLAPGWVRTAWGETAPPAWQERVRRETPLGVWGLPEDVAAAAAWLADPAAGYVTGQILRVNGGAVRG